MQSNKQVTCLGELEVVHTTLGDGYRLPRRPVTRFVACIATALVAIGVFLVGLVAGFAFAAPADVPLLFRICWLVGLSPFLLLGLCLIVVAILLVLGRTEIVRQDERLVRRLSLGPIYLSSRRTLQGIGQFTVLHSNDLAIELRAEWPSGETWRLASLYPKHMLATLGQQLVTDMQLAGSSASKAIRVEYESRDAHQFYERPYQPTLSKAVLEKCREGISITSPKDCLRRVALQDGMMQVHYEDGSDLEQREWPVEDIQDICATGEADEYDTVWHLTVASKSDSPVHLPAPSKAEAEWIATVLRRQIGIVSDLRSAVATTSA